MTPKPAQYEEFTLAALPINWYEVAKLMHDSARALFDAPQGYITHSGFGSKRTTRQLNNRPVFLLAAFALENLIKAYLVYENPHYIEGGKLSKKLLNGHSLSKLQKDCKRIPSPKRTKHVFETLEFGVNSWARYPCGTSSDRHSPELSMTPELWDAYTAVFELYSRRLEFLLSKKWKGPYGEVGYVVFSDRIHSMGLVTK